MCRASRISRNKFRTSILFASSCLFELFASSSGGLALGVTGVCASRAAEMINTVSRKKDVLKYFIARLQVSRRLDQCHCEAHASTRRAVFANLRAAVPTLQSVSAQSDSPVEPRRAASIQSRLGQPSVFPAPPSAAKACHVYSGSPCVAPDLSRFAPASAE